MKSIFTARLIVVHLVIISMLGNPRLLAQYDYEPAELPMPDQRNTLGFNLSPPLVVLMSALPLNPRFGLYYKRQTKPNHKFRVQANYERIAFVENERSDLPLNWSDTTITFLLESQNHYNLDLRLGMEFFKPGQTTSMVYGFDFFLGTAYRRDASLTSPYYLDPELEVLVPSPFTAPASQWQEVDYLLLGFDFSIGQKIHLRDHVYLCIQWTPEVVYQLPYREVYSDPLVRTEAPPSTLEFRFRGIEVYFNYMFGKKPQGKA